MPTCWGCRVSRHRLARRDKVAAADAAVSAARERQEERGNSGSAKAKIVTKKLGRCICLVIVHALATDTPTTIGFYMRVALGPAMDSILQFPLVF